MIVYFINVFFCSLTLGSVREYFQTTHTLAPFSHTPMSSNTTYFSFFLEDYELDQNFELSFDSFKWTFQCMPHLSTSGPFGWFLNVFRIIFIKRFNEWILLIISSLSHIAQGHIPAQIACDFKVVCLLNMTKPSSGICPIVMGETLYWFKSPILCFKFHNVFVTHFSPHQFKITTKGGYEVIIHDIMWTLDLHLA